MLRNKGKNSLDFHPCNMGWCVSGMYEKSEKEVHATVTGISVGSSYWKRQMPSMKKELGPLRFVYHNSSYLCPCSILAQLFGFSYVWWFQIVQLKNFNVLEDRQWLSSVTKILKQCDTQHSQALNKIPNGNVLKQTKWASGLMFQFSARILEEGKGTRHLQDKKSIRPERKVFI